MNAFKVKSITGRVHDTSFGGYPYKIVVMVEIDTKAFNKMCPVIGKARTSMYGPRQSAPRDLGNLVLDVNNALYSINSNIPAYNPSIDSQGSSRAKNGIKTMEFVYFLRDHDRAEALGFKVMRFKNGECSASYGDYVSIPVSTKLEVVK